jgi:hypothetical protein
MSVVFLAALVTTGIALVAAETCFYQHDKTDGQNKICYYSCPSGDAAITVKSYQLCPISIKR